MPDGASAVLRICEGALDREPAGERPELEARATRANAGTTEGQGVRDCGERQHSQTGRDHREGLHSAMPPFENCSFIPRDGGRATVAGIGRRWTDSRPAALGPAHLPVPAAPANRGLAAHVTLLAGGPSARRLSECQKLRSMPATA